ncbi:hypothetical protein [Brevundimonas goettingensis]|uniref:Uncharacterized protein n=1 Tax=Brevundimonas goettingensis TaxID=2774190 RepID=A0A975BZ66_9CAUL|nr:hypothetical protein [Brevundimonas goettingensis]QTC90541.1 hypothetical protein IFJ75_14860 [Brevundimonas goettingensis]
MKLGLFSALTALALGPAGGALAQTARAQTAPVPAAASSDPDGDRVGDIDVVAATRRAMGTYAREVGSGPMGRLSPRWDDRICVHVAFMDAEHATFLRDRVGAVAKAIGLSPDPSPDCRPDISIFASDDPDALADELMVASPISFRPARRAVSLGDAALEAFRTSDAPVRWWQVSLPLMSDSGQVAIPLGAMEPDMMSRSVTVRNGSRLRGNVRDDLVGVTIILDMKKLEGVPFNAVSDYVAFVALAPADPRVETDGFDTVLNLFERPGVTGLTLTDEDYLFALYSASRDPMNASIQASEIADRMTTERRRRSAEQRRVAAAE